MFVSLEYGITGRAIKKNLFSVNVWNPRDFTHNKHRTVDDRPYGGGPGMVMMAQPLLDAIQAAKKAAPGPTQVIYLSPQGKCFNQAMAENLLASQRAILIAGRYEGIDERALNLAVDDQWSMGDFILSGGELAAMTIIDATARLLPGALGDAESVAQDTFSAGLLKYPQYTRPEVINGTKVPDVLLCGNHQQIDRWRKKQSLGSTWLKRPDLLTKVNLDSLQLELLLEFIQEQRKPL